LFSFPFFFYSSPALRFLHSFPTRRSSDLVGMDAPAAGSSARPHSIHPHFLLVGAMVCLRVDGIVGVGPALERVLQGAEGVELNEDRKSTRLNSSHLGISYAVFCLKKKNKI